MATELFDAGFSAVYEFIRPLFFKLSFLFGGIFGLYLILILVRVFYERKKIKILKDIRFNLDQLNIHHKVKYSKDNKGKIKSWFSKVYNKSKTKKTKDKK